MKFTCPKCAQGTAYNDNHVASCSKCKSQTAIEKCDGFYKYMEVCTNKKCNHKVYIAMPINVYKEEEIKYDPEAEYAEKLCCIHKN